MKNYTLRQLCELCGVTRRAVQGYEKHGLISPCGKTERCYLLYDETAAEKAKKIKLLQNFGFTVGEIKQYFEGENEAQKGMLKQKLAELEVKKEKTEAYIKEINLLLKGKES